MRQAGREIGEHHRHAAGEHVLDGRRRALVGHMQHVDFGPMHERLAGDDAGGVGAGKRQLAGIGLGIFDQLLDRLGRHARIYHQHQREASHACHSREVLHRIVAHVPHQERSGRKRGISRHQQRVAVRRRARDVKRGQRPVRARAILDDDGLLERDAERLGDHAANRVTGTAGAEHGDEGDRLAWIVVGAERWADQCHPAATRMRSSFFMRSSSLAVASYVRWRTALAWERA